MIITFQVKQRRHVYIYKTGMRHSAIPFKTVQYFLGFISLQRAWSHKQKYTSTALLHKYQYQNEIFDKNISPLDEGCVKSKLALEILCHRISNFAQPGQIPYKAKRLSRSSTQVKDKAVCFGSHLDDFPNGGKHGLASKSNTLLLHTYIHICIIFSREIIQQQHKITNVFLLSPPDSMGPLSF